MWTLEQASALVAFISAVAALVVTVLGVLERRRSFALQAKAFDAATSRQHDEVERWKKEFDAGTRRERVALRRDFMLEQYKYRLASYGAVMRTLGSVSDVDLRSDPNAHQQLLADEQGLRTIAFELRQHLYSEPGLLMTMKTRGYLHAARTECLRAAANPANADSDALSDAFFYARRYLRADLEMVDDRSPENLEQMVKDLGAESTTTPPG